MSNIQINQIIIKMYELNDVDDAAFCISTWLMMEIDGWWWEWHCPVDMFMMLCEKYSDLDFWWKIQKIMWCWITTRWIHITMDNYHNNVNSHQLQCHQKSIKFSHSNHIQTNILFFITSTTTNTMYSIYITTTTIYHHHYHHIRHSNNSNTT